MSKKNEDNIERFFRKAVRQYDTPFMESDWQKMKKMLDEEAIESAAFLRAKHLRQATLSLVILLLITSGVYFFVSVRNQDNSSAKNENPEQIQAQASPGAFVDGEKSKNQSPTLSSSSDRNLSIDEKKVILAGDQKNVNPVMTEASGNQNGLAVGVENSLKDPAAAVSSGINSEPVDAPVEEEIADEEIKKEEIPVRNTEPSPEDQEQRIPARWNVALVIAPDFTSTVLGKYTAPGKAFGVTAGYQLFKRFAISTGFIISTKKYEGFGSDYHPPEGYWRNKTNGIIPEEIAGTCEVYEVPVTLQYLLFQKRKTNVSIRAGVSSYVVASQRYVYTYEQPNPGAAKGWSTSESSSYPFNIGHFSLALERQVFSKLAIGLEPYVKIPFTGMGWSDVDLFSTGVFINLRYRFFKTRTVAIKNAN